MWACGRAGHPVRHRELRYLCAGCVDRWTDDRPDTLVVVVPTSNHIGAAAARVEALQSALKSLDKRREGRLMRSDERVLRS